MNEKNITLKWHKPYEFDELDNFFKKEGKGLGGLYLWIFKGKPERIRYIGESQNFKKRFNDHFSNVAHGLYTAVNCKTNEDLCKIYRKISEKSSKEAESKKLCYFPKNTKIIRETLQKAKFSRKTRQKYIKNVKKRIQLYLNNFLNCYFVFAEIEFAEIKRADVSHKPKIKSAGRKKIESIFMHKTKKAYLGDVKKCWKDCKNEKQALWGTVNQDYDKNCQYKFMNIFPDENTRLKIKNILKDIGIELNYNAWTFLEEDK